MTKSRNIVTSPKSAIGKSAYLTTSDQNTITLSNFRESQLLSPAQGRQGQGRRTKKQTFKFIETSVQNKPAVKAPLIQRN